jgi:hypothetical protein
MNSCELDEFFKKVHKRDKRLYEEILTRKNVSNYDEMDNIQ